MSSSASRKTSLSSTRTTAMGWPAIPTSIGLFDREEKRVMRLPALVHLDLEARVGGANRGDDRVRNSGSVSDEHRENVGVLADEACDDVFRHGFELVPGANGLSLHEPEELPLLDVHIGDRRRA